MIPIKVNMARFTFREELGMSQVMRVTSWKEHTFMNTATSCLKDTGGNFDKFGDKAGIGKYPWSKDFDTGANLQRCVFPSSVRW